MQQKIYYEKIEINLYRNEMNTETKETQIIQTWLNPMMKYKIK